MTQRLVRVLWDKAWLEKIDPSTETSQANTRGDAAANFCAENCRLSFFRLPPEGMSVERIAVGVATLRSSLDDVDYCFVDQSEVERLGCTIDDSVAGATLFADVNDLHVDVCNLNLPRLCGLTFLAVASEATGRVRGRHVRKLLIEAIKAGGLDPSKLKQGLRKALEN